MEPEQRERAESGKSTPIEDCDIFGCEEVMDLSFRACKLQVQITVKGQYQNPSDLMEKYWNLASYIWQKVIVICETCIVFFLICREPHQN